MSERILEGVSEPQHLESEVVERAHEATMVSNDLTSTPSVFSLVHDDMPTLDESIPPMETTMDMVDDDAHPTWFYQDEVDHDLVFNTSPTTHE